MGGAIRLHVRGLQQKRDLFDKCRRQADPDEDQGGAAKRYEDEGRSLTHTRAVG
jgi:hypothetical protein